MPRTTAPVVVSGSPLWPPLGGIQRVARGLTRQLLSDAEPGQIRVVRGPPEFGGIDGAAPGGRIGRVLWEQAVLPLAAHDAAVILNLGNLAPVLSGKNLVLTYDLHALRFPSHYRRSWARLYWSMSATAYRRAIFRVTLSRTVADDLEATLGGHVDAVLSPGIDEAFRPAPTAAVEAVRTRLRLEGPYLVLVGWTLAAKRPGLALEAHRRLARQVPHALVLVGAPRAGYARADLGPLPATAVVAGMLSDIDLAALLSGSCGLLFCTEYEGFGLPPVEALACGAPVAASGLPVLHEVLDGLPGVRFVERSTPAAWTEAAAALLEHPTADPDSSEALRRSQATLERYSWEGKGRALLDIVAR